MEVCAQAGAFRCVDNYYSQSNTKAGSVDMMGRSRLEDQRRGSGHEYASTVTIYHAASRP
jgi:hypothetical protein